ncbi:MAG: hypothetical protein V7L25_16045 [Nostoc sp.]|uniref:hypothetical protein n=1 Tax=Nostoc sp. TaxID=1180 RepID=UPI002FF4058B
MRIKRLSSNVVLWLAISFLPLLMAQSVRAVEQKNQQAMQGGENSNPTTTKIKRLSEISRPVRMSNSWFPNRQPQKQRLLPMKLCK